MHETWGGVGMVALVTDAVGQALRMRGGSGEE